MRSLFIILIFTVISAWSSPLKVTETDKKIDFHIFNGEVEEAESLLNSMINKHTDNPKYYALKTQFYFYSRYFGPRTANFNDSLQSLILVEGQKAIDLAEKNEDDLASKFYAGLAHAFMARVHMMRGNYWDAFNATDDAEDLFEEVLEEDHNNADALLAAAIREYFVENNMGWWAYAGLYTLGFGGDRQHAIDNIQKVASEGKLFKNEARFILTVVNGGLAADIKPRLAALTELNTEFPNNRFIQAQFEQARFYAFAEEKGADYIAAHMDEVKGTFNITNPGLLNMVGYRFINQSRIEEAIKIFNTNVQLFPDVANCYDSLAEGYMVNGQNDQAVKYYKMAYQKLPADTTITDQFREFLKEGIEERLDELGSTVTVL